MVIILNLFISFLNPLSICNFYFHRALFVFFSSQNASPDVCKVLVGNKIDCDDERVIDTDKGKSVGLVFFILLNRSIKEQFWSHKLFKAIHLEAYIFLTSLSTSWFYVFIVLFRRYIVRNVLVQDRNVEQ